MNRLVARLATRSEPRQADSAEAGRRATNREEGMATHFELYKDRKGEFRWRLRHRNGNILATSSEGYKAKADAMKCIENVKASGESPVSEL